jgi:hypothetical protein
MLQTTKGDGAGREAAEAGPVSAWLLMWCLSLSLQQQLDQETPKVDEKWTTVDRGGKKRRRKLASLEMQKNTRV